MLTSSRTRRGMRPCSMHCTKSGYHFECQLCLQALGFKEDIHSLTHSFIRLIFMSHNHSGKLLGSIC